MSSPLRRRLPKAERRALILEAAQKVFVNNGVGGTRVVDIADAAGVNTALMYQHFSSKEELFSEAVIYPLEQLLERTEQQTRKLAIGAENIQQRTTEEFVREILYIMVELSPLFGTVLFGDPEVGKKFYRDRLEPMLSRIVNLVQKALPTWRHVDFDARRTTVAVFGMSWFLAMDSSMREETLDVDGASKELTRLLFTGLQDDPRDGDE
ncbi:TetR/AcrR family transcriptional regulator [Mycobacterium sp. Lab-001]|uniref:TetR/AcrR family transcriptional regulator n=1 Tax=Mycobacterium sp. Lab-001 TaxID=3410136 RepID=UPI003D16F95A